MMKKRKVEVWIVESFEHGFCWRIDLAEHVWVSCSRPYKSSNTARRAAKRFAESMGWEVVE